MAVSNVLPASGSTLGYAEQFSFEATDGYASLQIRVTVAGGGLESVYDDGVAPGYVVVVEDLGATVQFTVTRDSGWSIDPLTVYVTEDGVNTEWTYDVFPTQEYAEGMQPYNALGTSTSGGVTTFITRDGNVVAVAGDYAASLITNDSSVTGAYVDDALDQLDADITAIPAAPVDSVFGRTGAVVAVLDDYDDLLVTHDATLGTPTTTTVAGVLQDTGAVSVVNGGGLITDNGDGTIQVTGGYGYIRATDSDGATLSAFDFVGVNPQALTDTDMNYVYVEYNAGTPQIAVSISKPTDHNTNVFLGTVYRDGTTVHITDHKAPTGNLSNKVTRYLTQIHGLANVSGAATSESGTARTIAITAGEWWHGMEETSTDAIDTNVADTFFRYYQDGVGGWTTDSAETVISNTEYDDGDGGLGLLTGMRYGVHWVFKAIDGDTYVVFGRGNYTAAQAQEATIPNSLPPHFAENHATLCAKITVQKDATNFSSVESAFVKHFTSGAPTSHADLADLGADDHTQYAETLDGAGAPGASTGNGYRLGTTYADTTGDESYILVDATTDANVWSAGGESDHGALTGLSDDDHTHYVLADGTREQDGLWLNNQASAAAPGAGKGRLWFLQADPSRLYWTDDDDGDHLVPKFEELLSNPMTEDLDAAGYAVHNVDQVSVQEQTSVTAPDGGEAKLWVASRVPNIFMQTDDADVDAALVQRPGLRYEYDDTTTASGITTGTMRWNNATQSSATEIYVYMTDKDGLNNQYVSKNMESGSGIWVTKESDPSQRYTAAITEVNDNSVGEGPSYYTLTIQVDGVSTNWVNMADGEVFYFEHQAAGSERRALTIHENATLLAETDETNRGHLWNKSDFYSHASNSGKINEAAGNELIWTDSSGNETELAWLARNYRGSMTGQMMMAGFQEISTYPGGTAKGTTAYNIKQHYCHQTGYHYQGWIDTAADGRFTSSPNGRDSWDTTVVRDTSVAVGDGVGIATNGTILCVAIDGYVYESTDLTVTNLEATGSSTGSNASCELFWHEGSSLWVHIGDNGTTGLVHTATNPNGAWTLRYTFPAGVRPASADKSDPNVGGWTGAERMIVVCGTLLNDTFYSDNGTTWTQDGSGNPTYGGEVILWCPGLISNTTINTVKGGAWMICDGQATANIWTSIDHLGSTYYDSLLGGTLCTLWSTPHAQGYFNGNTCYNIYGVGDSSASDATYGLAGYPRTNYPVYTSRDANERFALKGGNGVICWDRNSDQEGVYAQYGPIRTVAPFEA